MTQRGDTQINVFTKGLITESNPLNFPVDAAVDVINMHLKRNGTMERRLGMDFEDSYVLTSTGLSSDVLAGARVTAYRWSIPNGQSEVDIGVIQIGNRLYFLDLYAVAPSAVLLNGGVPVTAVGTSNDQIMSFATINNYLVAVSNALADPYLFSYDADTDVVSWETAPILIRDLYGVDDGLDVNERPTVLTSEHTYNLKNQGWNDDVKTTCGAGINAIDCTFNTFGVYPSNSDIWSLGRIEDLTSADVYKFDPNLAARNLVQIGQASRGHFIIPIFGRGQARQDLTGLTLPADRETGAITYVASYAGRVFYAGILSRVVDGDNNSPSFSGTVFFSQVFTNKDNLIKCYQEADPTSPEINDMIDTDGGTIQIPGCNYIYALIPTKTSLFVFGANGVWEIRGDEGGFRATSFQVNKISNVGVYAPKSIVEINNTFIFWGDSGIYTLSPNEFGLWNTENITLNTIQRFFNALPDSSKKNARGYHDLHTNTARWLYYSSDTHVVGDPIDQETTPAPEVPVSVPTPISLLSAAGNHPEIAKINSSKVFVIYTKTPSEANTVLYWRRVDYTTDLVGSVTTEGTLIASTGVAYTGYSIKYLQDNKIILVYTKNIDTYAAIVNFDPSTGAPTIGSSVLLNSVFTPVLTTSTLQLTYISANRVVVGNKNTDNNKPTCQVIDIDTSDNITFGAVAKSTSTGSSNPTIVMLTTTKGVMCWNTFANMAMEVFTISGTTITFNGTSYTFPSASQISGHSNYTCINADIIKVDSTHIGVYGTGSSTVISQSTVNHPSGFIVLESSGVLTSTTIWKNTEYTTSSTLTTDYPALVTDDGARVFSLHASNDTLTNKLYLTNWEGTLTTPVFNWDITIDSWSAGTSITHEELVYLGTGNYVGIAVRTGTNVGLYHFAVKAHG